MLLCSFPSPSIPITCSARNFRPVGINGRWFELVGVRWSVVAARSAANTDHRTPTSDTLTPNYGKKVLSNFARCKLDNNGPIWPENKYWQHLLPSADSKTALATSREKPNRLQNTPFAIQTEFDFERAKWIIYTFSADSGRPDYDHPDSAWICALTGPRRFHSGVACKDWICALSNGNVTMFARILP